METITTILGIIFMVLVLVIVSIWVGEMINDDKK